MMRLVSGRCANAPGAIIQDDLGAMYGLTAPLGLLLEWHHDMRGGVLDTPPAVLHVLGHITVPIGIGVGPGAWFVTNVP